MNPSCIYNRQSKAVRALWNFLTSPTGAFLIAVSAILIGYYQFSEIYDRNDGNIFRVRQRRLQNPHQRQRLS